MEEAALDAERVGMADADLEELLATGEATISSDGSYIEPTGMPGASPAYVVSPADDADTGDAETVLSLGFVLDSRPAAVASIRRSFRLGIKAAAAAEVALPEPAEVVFLDGAAVEAAVADAEPAAGAGNSASGISGAKRSREASRSLATGMARASAAAAEPYVPAAKAAGKPRKPRGPNKLKKKK